MDRLISFHRLHDELFCDVECTCQRPSIYPYVSLIRLYGHYDDCFFNVINERKRSFVCPACGAEIKYRWTKAGVAVWDS